MDRVMQIRNFEEAERHVVDGARRIARQERLIAQLDRHGHNTFEARRLLKNFRTSQKLHLEHRSRIVKQLKP